MCSMNSLESIENFNPGSLNIAEWYLGQTGSLVFVTVTRWNHDRRARTISITISFRLGDSIIFSREA